MWYVCVCCLHDQACCCWPHKNAATSSARFQPQFIPKSQTPTSVGFLRKSFTVAVSSCSCTGAVSSGNVSRKLSSSSSALSMRSAYSPASVE